MTSTASDRILNDLKFSLEQEMREKITNELRAELLAKLSAVPGVRVSVKATVTKPAAKKARKGPGPKRSPEEIAKTSNDVLAYIGAHPSASAEAIRTALNVPLAVIELPIKKLLAGKMITRKGQKRATRYYAKGGN